MQGDQGVLIGKKREEEGGGVRGSRGAGGGRTFAEREERPALPPGRSHPPDRDLLKKGVQPRRGKQKDDPHLPFYYKRGNPDL